MAGRGKVLIASLLCAAVWTGPAYAFVLGDAIAELKSDAAGSGGQQTQAQTILDYVVRPRLITSSPANGAANEPPIFLVRLDLSVPTAQANVTAGSVRLEVGGSVVTATLELSPDGETITVTPDAAYNDQVILGVIESVAVRVLLDEDVLVDPLGFPIDADGNGTYGGDGVLSFATGRSVKFENAVLGPTFTVANGFQPPLSALPAADGVNFAASGPPMTVMNAVQPSVEDLPGNLDSAVDGYAGANLVTVANTVQPDLLDLPGALLDGFATAPYFTVDNAIMMLASAGRSCDIDADADGLPSCAEDALGLGSLLADTDGDGVGDGEEDSDGDGVPNADEWRAGTLFEKTAPSAKLQGF